MFKKFIHFVKYNNLAVFVMLGAFLVGGGVFAQTEVGQEFIGEKRNRTEGVDNTLLLAAEIDEIDMNFKIERIEEDEKYYFVVYTFYDLVLENDVWQYQIREKTRKISKKSGKDLGLYLAKEFREQYEDRVRFLVKKQLEAKDTGEEKKIEVEEYSGLIGQTLELTGKVFSGYEPVKKRVVPSPSVPVLLTTIQKSLAVGDDEAEKVSKSDSLTDVYNNYMTENDPDEDGIFSVDDNCPDVYNARQYDNDNDGIGDECDDSYDVGSSSVPIDVDDKTITSEEVIDDATSTEPVIIDDTSSSTNEVVEDEIDIDSNIEDASRDSSASAQNDSDLLVNDAPDEIDSDQEESEVAEETGEDEDELSVEIIELDN